MKKAVICAGVRIPFVRSWTRYNEDSNQDLLTFAVKALVNRFDLRGKVLGDCAMGAVLKHPKDFNLAREAVLGSGLDPHTPAYDVQRACGTSLEAVINLANKIMTGQVESGIAGGVDTNSDIPMILPQSMSHLLVKLKLAKTPMQKIKLLGDLRPTMLVPQTPGVDEPRTGLRMGDHCELMAKEWRLSQKEQDEWAYSSHMKAAKAYEDGFYEDLVVPYRGNNKDSFVRGDTSVEKLGKLRPVFDKDSGTLTAGNSTPLSDGASCVLMASEDYAKKQGWPILAYFRDGQVAAVDFEDGEGLLMAPTYAISQLLERNEMQLQDFDFYEIHEAFAAQVLCTLRAWESAEYCHTKLGRSSALGHIDPEKINVKGGSVALGHPFGATGTRLVGTLAKLLEENGKGRGLISVCTGGGMGVGAILERP